MIEKPGGHKQIFLHHLKKYSIDECEKSPGKVTFPNFKGYNNVNDA